MINFKEKMKGGFRHTCVYNMYIPSPLCKFYAAAICRSLLRRSRIAINSADGVALQAPSQATTPPLLCLSSHEAVRIVGLKSLVKAISTLRQGLVAKKRLPFSVKEWADAVQLSGIVEGSTSPETLELLDTCLTSEIF